MDSASIIIIVFGVLIIVGGPIVANYVSKASNKDAMDTAKKNKRP